MNNASLASSVGFRKPRSSMYWTVAVKSRGLFMVRDGEGDARGTLDLKFYLSLLWWHVGWLFNVHPC